MQNEIVLKGWPCLDFQVNGKKRLYSTVCNSHIRRHTRICACTRTHTHAHTVRLDKEHDRHYINQWIRPHFWFVVYSDQHTCEPHPPNIDETIEYEMEFLNPDSSGNATDHFGDNLRGI